MPPPSDLGSGWMPTYRTCLSPAAAGTARRASVSSARMLLGMPQGVAQPRVRLQESVCAYVRLEPFRGVVTLLSRGRWRDLRGHREDLHDLVELGGDPSRQRHRLLGRAVERDLDHHGLPGR